MSGPLEFAARLLSRRGALLESHSGAVEAVLSRELGAELGLGEHAILTETPSLPEAHHVGYGSALLERMVATATRTIPFVAARTAVAPIRENQARTAAEAMVFRNGVFSVGEPAAAVGHRVVAHANFTIHGDERREGLCAAAASLRTHGTVVGFEEAVAGTLSEIAVAVPEPERLLTGARAALSACAAHAAEVAAGFREGMQRRFSRDRERLEGYFADLIAEFDQRVSRGRSHTSDLRDKRQVLERERSAKLEALSVRYVMKVEIEPVALLLIEAPVYLVPLDLRRRKASRSIEVEYDCTTRRLVSPTCDACGASASRPAACDGAVHLLCETCAPKSEGRIVCRACRRKRS